MLSPTPSCRLRPLPARACDAPRRYLPTNEVAGAADPVAGVSGRAPGGDDVIRAARSGRRVRARDAGDRRRPRPGRRPDRGDGGHDGGAGRRACDRTPRRTRASSSRGGRWRPGRPASPWRRSARPRSSPTAGSTTSSSRIRSSLRAPRQIGCGGWRTLPDCRSGRFDRVDRGAGRGIRWRRRPAGAGVGCGAEGRHRDRRGRRPDRRPAGRGGATRRDAPADLGLGS